MEICCVGKLWGAVGWRDGNAPREGSWVAKKLLIEIVTPAPNGLAKKDGGSEKVKEEQVVGSG